MGTRRERNVHIEGRYSESVSDRREQPPDTLGGKHVDIANNTANTQRNLCLTITTSACDCTVRLEVTRVEATPRKTFSTQIGPPSAMLPLFGLAKLQMPCPWEQPRPIQPGQNVVASSLHYEVLLMAQKQVRN